MLTKARAKTKKIVFVVSFKKIKKIHYIYIYIYPQPSHFGIEYDGLIIF